MCVCVFERGDAYVCVCGKKQTKREGGKEKRHLPINERYFNVQIVKWVTLSFDSPSVDT